MGHLVGKTLYKRLSVNIDNMGFPIAGNQAFFAVLRHLYSETEASIVIQLPYRLSSLQQIEKLTKISCPKLEHYLEKLCFKGLVIDIWVEDQYLYMPSPYAVGIFEFTFMKTGPDADIRTIAKLFHEYHLSFTKGDRSSENRKRTKKPLPSIGIMRTIPYEEHIARDAYVEVLDYEKASAIVEQSGDKMAISHCSCRHQKYHAGTKECDHPLQTCSSFGWMADFVIRRGLGTPVTKTQMLENIARSKELKLVLNADNVKQNITFICHCCKCCCHTLKNMRLCGYPNIVVTSTLISKVDEKKCIGCGLCAEACPVDAIKMVPSGDKKKKKKPVLDQEMCLGCGICAQTCKTDAVLLDKREQRVIHPENTYERILLQSLRNGKLQHQLFPNPQQITHKAMRGILGAFLRLDPVKRGLMSDILRSRFLSAIKTTTTILGASRSWPE